MILKKLTASFGKLKGDSLQPGPGLNIIYAPNEGGKTTWSAFLRAMFYGIDTKERDTKTSLAEKNRWQPWSGGAMEGSMEISWRGRDIVLRRFFKANTPFSGFSATDAATGEELGEFTGETAGEAFLGVSRGVYERSAFIGQGAISFSGERELEKRIAALVSSGEETVSYSQADARLREWQRRRKYNKSGLIPRLEGELEAVDASLERTRRAHLQEENARLELLQLKPLIRKLEEEREIHKMLRQQELDRRCADARRALQEAKRQEDALRAEKEMRCAEAGEVQDSLFAGMTQDEALQKANTDALKAAERRKNGWLAVGLFSLLGVLVGAAMFVLWQIGVVHRVFWCAVGILPMLYGVWLGFRNRREEELLLERYGAGEPGDILARAAAYRASCQRAGEAARRAEEALGSAVIRREGAQRLVDALVQSGARPDAKPELLAAPVHTAAETEARLEEARAEFTRLNGGLAMARGELNTLGDPDALEARREELEQELTKRRREYDALSLALTELAEANSELQARFSPALNQKAGELMTRLTGGRYDSVTLTRDFQAMAGERDGVLPRRAFTLSQGTADQLYLAVRLAICRLALPEEDPAPLVLDDALASFDNRRMALALELLLELSKKRQILLFTCHRREAEYLKGRGDVTFLDLQS